jgi:hypothetical protein
LKGWGNIFADRLSQAGRLRSYLKAIVDKTWDLTVWLQHNSNATSIDADNRDRGNGSGDRPIRQAHPPS